jgi:acyl dehydratase
MTMLTPARVGEWSEELNVTVDADRARAYAAATNDDNRWFTSGRLASPVYAVALVVPAWEPAMRGAFGADPYALGSVHGEHDLWLHRPLEPGMRLRMRAAVVGVLPKSTGTQVVGRVETRDADGPVAEQLFVNFFRGQQVERTYGEAAPAHSLPAEVRAQPPLARVTYPVDMDQGVRYAHASGDMGIYHLDDEAAQRLGFPRRIVHGVCTMAFAGRAVVEVVCDGDPRRLKRLAVRFSAPLLPGQEVTTTLWSLDQRNGLARVGFEVADASGQLVITNGLAEVAA